MAESLEECKRLLKEAYNKKDNHDAYEACKNVIYESKKLNDSNEKYLLLCIAYLGKANIDCIRFNNDSETLSMGYESQYLQYWKDDIKEAYSNAHSCGNFHLTDRQKTQLLAAYNTIDKSNCSPAKIDNLLPGILAIEQVQDFPTDTEKREAKARQEGEAARGKAIISAVKSVVTTKVAEKVKQKKSKKGK